MKMNNQLSSEAMFVLAYHNIITIIIYLLFSFTNNDLGEFSMLAACRLNNEVHAGFTAVGTEYLFYK